MKNVSSSIQRLDSAGLLIERPAWHLSELQNIALQLLKRRQRQASRPPTEIDSVPIAVVSNADVKCPPGGHDGDDVCSAFHTAVMSHQNAGQYQPPTPPPSPCIPISNPPGYLLATVPRLAKAASATVQPCLADDTWNDLDFLERVVSRKCSC